MAATTGRVLGGRGERRFASVPIALGTAFVAAAVVFNPFTVGFWRGERALDFVDVFTSFARWTSTLGAGLLLAGVALRRAPSRRLARAIALVIGPSLVVVGDRALLASFGLTLWRFHPEKHFEHRPNAVRLTSNAKKVVRINSHGFHDDEFPVAKPAGEWRALMLGDSVTMGARLTADETFSSQLEKLLAERDVAHRSHQVINAGVQGYATFQEYLVFREALRFEPDLVVIGFCLNDVTELFRVQKEFGGTGIDYHGVQQAPTELLGWISNETGFGRLAQYLRRERSSLEARHRWEDYNVRDMMLGTGDPERYERAWDIVLADLAQCYALAREQDVEVLLLVFPYSTQLADPARLGPQRILAEHAREQGFDVLDLAATFTALIHDESGLARVRSGEIDAAELWAEDLDEVRVYYIDSNHFTPEGHRVIAAELFEHLRRRGLVRTEGEAAGIASRH